MVDLKVVDAQALEDGHTLLQDVQRLTQPGVGCAVHSAHLRTQHSLTLSWTAGTHTELTGAAHWYRRVVPLSGITN